MDDIRRRCGREGGSVYDLVNGMVSGIGPGESDLVFLPFLHGSADTPGARGTLIGLTPAHDMRHVLRAVFEGVVFSHLAHLEKLLKHRERPGSVRLSGGAAKSEAWVRMFADILQIPIEIVAEKETGAAGAALAAGVAAGIYRDFRNAAEETVRIAGTVQPRTENRNVYERKYRLYGEIADSLASAWNRFGE